jgi:hypothetical protein
MGGLEPRAAGADGFAPHQLASDGLRLGAGKTLYVSYRYRAIDRTVVETRFNAYRFAVAAYHFQVSATATGTLMMPTIIRLHFVYLAAEIAQRRPRQIVARPRPR